MSYSFDSDGWDLFTTPFSSTPTRTASASSTQQAERPRQKPSEASPHNTTPPAAQRNPLPTQKAAPPVRQTADTQQKQIDEQKAPTATASASDENPALESSAPSPAQAQPDIAKQEQADPPKTPVPAQADSAKQEQAAPTKAPAPASTPPVAPQKELVLDMSSGSGAGAGAGARVAVRAGGRADAGNRTPPRCVLAHSSIRSRAGLGRTAARASGRLQTACELLLPGLLRSQSGPRCRWPDSR